MAQKPAPINDNIRLQLLFQQSHSDSLRNDHLSALKHLNQYLLLKDSLLEKTRQRQIEQLQKQYQTIKKDLEIGSREKNINLLISQNHLMDKNLQQAWLIRKIIMAVFIALALLLLVSFFRYRIKKRANLRLQKQQDAIDEQNRSLRSLAQQKDSLLEEKELLIKEIHHRVKNNLQVVISLLNTQSAYLNDPQAEAAIRQSQHRMRSISLIHQKLYQSESRALINMHEYTTELVQYLRQSFDTGSRIAFKLNIGDIDLDVLRAVPIALIMNEAITNALKYAFPDDSEGYVKIELSCIDGKYLKLMVTDNGQGLPPQFNIDLCGSLGLNLIKGMCRQINGHFALQNENGVIIMIQFPLNSTSKEMLANDDISSFDDDSKYFLFDKKSQ